MCDLRILALPELLFYVVSSAENCQTGAMGAFKAADTHRLDCAALGEGRWASGAVPDTNKGTQQARTQKQRLGCLICHE